MSRANFCFWATALLLIDDAHAEPKSHPVPAPSSALQVSTRTPEEDAELAGSDTHRLQTLLENRRMNTLLYELGFGENVERDGDKDLSCDLELYKLRRSYQKCVYDQKAMEEDSTYEGESSNCEDKWLQVVDKQEDVIPGKQKEVPNIKDIAGEPDSKKMAQKPPLVIFIQLRSWTEAQCSGFRQIEDSLRFFCYMWEPSHVEIKKKTLAKLGGKEAATTAAIADLEKYHKVLLQRLECSEQQGGLGKGFSGSFGDQYHMLSMIDAAAQNFVNLHDDAAIKFYDLLSRVHSSDGDEADITSKEGNAAYLKKRIKDLLRSQRSASFHINAIPKIFELTNVRIASIQKMLEGRGHAVVWCGTAFWDRTTDNEMCHLMHIDSVGSPYTDRLKILEVLPRMAVLEPLLRIKYGFIKQTSDGPRIHILRPHEVHPTNVIIAYDESDTDPGQDPDGMSQGMLQRFKAWFRSHYYTNLEHSTRKTDFGETEVNESLPPGQSSFAEISQRVSLPSSSKRSARHRVHPTFQKPHKRRSDVSPVTFVQTQMDKLKRHDEDYTHWIRSMTADIPHQR